MSVAVVRKLQENGYSAYWVGGCVRDELLGRPVKDRDVATDATPEEVLALFPDARRLGERFGVIAVGDVGGRTEVATFRQEFGYSDGRRPDRVTYTSDPEVDVHRRDFTVNGILYDPLAGRHLDYVGGMEDLGQRLLRAIGDPVDRFREDRLRMLRAARLAASLGFEIEADTFAAIRKEASAIGSVAPERLREELTRILTESAPGRGFELLYESGLLGHLLPEVAALRGVDQPPEFHPEGDVWTHTMLMLDRLTQPSASLAWGVLLHDIGKPGTFSLTDRIRFHGHVDLGVELAQGICARFRFSNADRQHIVALVANHMKFMSVRQMRPARVRRFVDQKGFEDHLELHRVDCLSSHGKLENYDFAREALEKSESEEPVRRLLTGHDLIAAGYQPGPAFGKILAAVEERQLDGEIFDREEALRFVRRQFPAGAS